jgi:regulatory LuxR family protein
MALTERQQEIKALLDKGKTPREVGEALGISENAVYQHRRRMGVKSSSTRRGSAKRADESTRVRAAAARAQAPAKRTTQRKRTQQPRKPQLAAVPTGPTTPEAMDPLTAVRHRRTEVNSLIEGARFEAEAAAKVAATAQKADDEALAKVKVELDQLDTAEAVLTGKLKPPTKASRKPSNGKAQTPPTEPPAPTPAEPAPPAAVAEPEPEPTGYADAPEVPAEAAAQDAAAEAPDEPTEAGPSEEERPGAPTLPEFRQEDAFAS